MGISGYKHPSGEYMKRLYILIAIRSSKPTWPHMFICTHQSTKPSNRIRDSHISAESLPLEAGRYLIMLVFYSICPVKYISFWLSFSAVPGMYGWNNRHAYKQHSNRPGISGNDNPMEHIRLVAPVRPLVRPLVRPRLVPPSPPPRRRGELRRRL